jgi:hypothetical protein
VCFTRRVLWERQRRARERVPGAPGAEAPGGGGGGRRAIRGSGASTATDATVTCALVRAVADFAGGDAGDLAFHVGDAILVFVQDPCGWWRGRLLPPGVDAYSLTPETLVASLTDSTAARGGGARRVGWFPCTYVEWVDLDMSSSSDGARALAGHLQSMAAAAVDEGGSGRMSLSLSSRGRPPPVPSDLSLSMRSAGGRHSRMSALQLGFAAGGGGDMSTGRSAGKAAPPRYVRGVAAFEAGDPAELSFGPGAVLRVLDDDGSGWMRGEVLEGGGGGVVGATGWFPCTFCEAVTRGADGSYVAE